MQPNLVALGVDDLAGDAPESQRLALDASVRRAHAAIQAATAPAQAVQRKAAGAASEDDGAVHAAARQGMTGAAGRLPFAERIQAAFGRHSLAGVRAFGGDAARQANEAMGARAYASGDGIAFRSTPDLRTAAHEAAHVVQQRAGVTVPGGVGRAGDTYERHADAVADAVVAGGDAERLLDRVAGAGAIRGGAATAVQRAPEERPGDECDAWRQDEALVFAIERDLFGLRRELVSLEASGQRASSRWAALMERRLALLEVAHDARQRITAREAGAAPPRGCTELGLLGVLGANTVGPQLKGEYQGCVRTTSAATTSALIGVGGAVATAASIRDPGALMDRLDRVVELATQLGTQYDPQAPNVVRPPEAGSPRRPGTMSPVDYVEKVQETRGGRVIPLFELMERDLTLVDRSLEATVFRTELEVLGVPVKLAIVARGRLTMLGHGSVGPGSATLQDYDGAVARATIDVPARVDVDLDASGELEASASLAEIDAAALKGELALHGTGVADLGWQGQLEVSVGADGHVRTRPLSHRLSGNLELRARLTAHAALTVLGEERWRGDWTLAEGALDAAREVELGWHTIGSGAAMKAQLTGDASGVDPGAVAKEAVDKAKKDETVRPSSLLGYLQTRHKTAHTIDPDLRGALDGAPAPKRGTTKLADSLKYVYRARPSLAPLFQRGTTVGDGLVEDLKTVKVPTPVGERRFEPGRPGGYYALIREQVQDKKKLDKPVREPTVIESVLKVPNPQIPGPVKEEIRQWLATTALPDRSLPDDVRAAMLAEVRKVTLEPEEEGLELVVRLPDETRAAIERILGDAKSAEPARAAVYDWWLEHFEQPELHHIWPKWMQGDEGQVCLLLPRIVHNMAGVGLDEGGFHQRLNALFAKEPMFVGLTAEDKKGFEKALQAATEGGERGKFLAAAHDILIEAYAETLGSASVLTAVRARLGRELDQVTQTSQP